MTLDDIRQPVEQEMKAFEPFFRQQLQSPNALLAHVTNYMLRRKGKQMRPLLVFLAAKATGQVTKATYAAATLIELLHTASLVHDDVVDETFERRSQRSVNALWGSKVAVLIGDFFLSRGMSVAIEGGHVDILRVVSTAVSDLSEGELTQMAHAHKLDIDEQAYYDIIRCKTATLIGACTHTGAISSGADAQAVDALYRYGVSLGMAFQIRDDIFDYERTGHFGKPAGNDIRERKITLPLIAALGRATEQERRHLMKRIAVHHKDDATLREATALVDRYEGIAYAREQMLRYAREAKECIAQLPQSAARESLVQIVDFNTMRSH